MPERIQMSRQRPWRADNPLAIKVDRSTIWGNPFRISSVKETRKSPRWWSVSGPRDSWSYLGSERRAREIATEEFLRWLTEPELGIYDFHWTTIQKHQRMRAGLLDGALAGHDLACWCPLDRLCHADVLLELANA